MRIPVVIDGSAWNVLWNHQIDIGVELPADQFDMSMPREVEIELEAIPDTDEKRPLKDFIRAACLIRSPAVSQTFGFAEAQPPGTPHVYGGFGQGTFASSQEITYRARPETAAYIVGKSTRRKTGLGKNQADVVLSASSMSAVVVTADKKNGPLPEVASAGGMVVFLMMEIDPSGTLASAVSAAWTKAMC